MTFNRQVLEQVARDGVTYKSLAKEMAKALLEGSVEATPKVIKDVVLTSHDRESERMLELLPGKNVYQYDYDTVLDKDGDSHSVYTLTLRNP